MEDKVKNVNAAVPLTFRADPEDKQKFQEFAKENRINQAEMFEALLQTYEMANAMGQIPERGKEIETFQDTINKLSGMFINSLTINQTAEERIRETLSLELKTKDQAIADLQEYKLNAVNNIRSMTEELEFSKETVIESEGLILKVRTELEEKIKMAKDQQEQINALTVLVAESQGFRDQNKKLEEVNRNLISEKSTAAAKINNFEIELKGATEQKDFYRVQVETLKTEFDKEEENYRHEISSLKADFKVDIDQTAAKHEKEILELKADYKQQIVDLKNDLNKKFETELANKLAVEKSKYELLEYKNNAMTDALKKADIEDEKQKKNNAFLQEKIEEMSSEK